MTLAQDVSAFGAGSAVTNKVSTPVATLRGRASKIATLSSVLTSATSASSALVAYADIVDAKHPPLLSALPVTLPLMQSVYFLDQRLGVDQGSSSFNEYFGAMSSAESGVESLKTLAVNAVSSIASVAVTISGVTGTGDAAITSFLSVVPPATTTDPGTGNQVTNPAYTSFMTTNSAKITSMNTTLSNLVSSAQSATTQLSGYYSTIDSSYLSGLSKLKGAAFIGFVNASHPSEVQAVINSSINLASVPVIPA